MDLEKLTDDELKVLEKQFERIRNKANHHDRRHNAAVAVEKVSSELEERAE